MRREPCFALVRPLIFAYNDFRTAGAHSAQGRTDALRERKGEANDEYNLESEEAQFSGPALDFYDLWVLGGPAVH